MVGDEIDTSLAQAFLYSAGSTKDVEKIQKEKYISVFQCVISSVLSTFLEKKSYIKTYIMFLSNHLYQNYGML